MSALSPAMKAFPSEYLQERHKGMDLRDYFAAKALVGEMLRHGEDIDWIPRAGMIAESCYKVADAMMQAREAQR